VRRQRTVVSAVLGAAVLILTGCATGGTPTGPGETTGTEEPAPPQSDEHVQDAELGGAQPYSTDTADALMDSAVTNSEALMQHLGGPWDFPNGAGSFDAGRLRAESNPQPCTTQARDGGLTDGRLYSVVATSVAPDESAGETLERFEAALSAARYEVLEGNGTGTGQDSALANGQSAEGRVTLTRSSGNLTIQLRTACSTDPSLG
jgi:hypothetical protein